MILPFKPQFEQPINLGFKKHTIRVDKNNRWKAGNKIHMATGVRTKNYNCFNNKHTCISTQIFKLEWLGTTVLINIDNKNVCFFNTAQMWGDHSNNGFSFLRSLALNDGFQNIESFLAWFNKNYTGKIIHWTNLKY